MEINKLIRTVKTYRDAEVDSLLTTAFKIASVAHEGFQRQTGEPFINHPLAVASLLADWYAPPAVIAVGLLHDTINSKYSHGYRIADIQRRLGSEVSQLLEATTSLNGLVRRFEEDFGSELDVNIEGELGKETTANAILHEAIPFVQERDAFIIKIADRWHNLQTVATLPRDQQQRTARIILNIFAPLADRLGMGAVKRQLEDASFRIINPAYYTLLQQNAIDVRVKEEVGRMLEQLRQALGSLKVKSEVRWQPFSLYALSHHQAEQNIRHGNLLPDGPLSLRLEDVGSYVILTEEETDCYTLLGTIHKLYPPVEKRLRDYIGDPGENGYQALHTQVKYSPGQLLNIVICTFTMDLVAQLGSTAGWKNVSEELLPKLPTPANPMEGKIQVFTPNGEAKYLPQGATPIDFAYEIHTEVGNRCKGVLVNGKAVDLYHSLQDSDVVEILLGGPETQPSSEWLKHVHTLHADHRIRHYLAEQHRKVLEENGRTLLDRELQSLGLASSDDEVNRFFVHLIQKENLEGPEDILVNIGLGRYNASEIVERLTAKRTSKLEETTLSVNVLSPEAASLQKEMARCCNPTPPDDIAGYRRNSRVLAIHSSSCPRIKRIKERIPVEWNTAPPEPNYVIVVRALNRPGLASELSTVIAHIGFDMLRFDSRKLADGGRSETYIFLGDTTPVQRMRIQKELEDLPYVESVEAINSAFLPKPHLPNPYGPKPAIGHRFYGRDVESQRIRSLVYDSSQNSAILLWGQKRIGKTSLLFRLTEQAHQDFLPVYIDLQGLAYCSTTQFLSALINEMLQQIRTMIPESAQEIARHIPHLKKDPLGHFDRFIASVQKALEYHPLVVILDEFQYLCELREEKSVSSLAIFRHLRSLSQHGQGIHFIFSGGGLLSQLINQGGLGQLLNMTYDEKLGGLGEAAARNLITEGLSRVAVIEEEAVDLLLRITARHPYYLQMLCYKLYEQARQEEATITHLSASEAIYEWLMQADESRFQHLWEGSDGGGPQINKVILSAIAQLGVDNEAVEYEQLHKAVHTLIQERNLVRSLEDLAQMGILRHNQMNYAIEVELFARWLRQHWPLKLALKEAELV